MLAKLVPIVKEVEMALRVNAEFMYKIESRKWSIALASLLPSHLKSLKSRPEILMSEPAVDANAHEDQQLKVSGKLTGTDYQSKKVHRVPFFKNRHLYSEAATDDSSDNS